MQKNAWARQAWVDGDRRREQVDDGQAAEDALRDHRGQRAQASRRRVRATFGARGPDGQHEGQEAHAARDHPMSVLVEDAADHRGMTIP
jgi:hypothetical protein